MHHTSREIQLAQALVEAADTLTDAFEATRYLQVISDHCVELLAARAAGIMLIDGGRAVSLGDLLGPVFTEKYDLMFGADRFHPSATGYANMVSVLVPSMAAAMRERAAEASSVTRLPRDVMSLDEAADRAERRPGTEVSQQGRWATVLRRRRAS